MPDPTPIRWWSAAEVAEGEFPRWDPPALLIDAHVDRAAHSDPRVAEILQRFRLLMGDWELYVTIADLAAVPGGFATAAANLVARQLDTSVDRRQPTAAGACRIQPGRYHHELRQWPDTAQARKLVQGRGDSPETPAAALWEAAAFGRRAWDRKSVLPDPVPPASRDHEWVHLTLPPDLDENGALLLMGPALERMRLLGRVDDSRLAARQHQRLQEDLTALAELCALHGAFAEAVIPGALDPATDLLVTLWDGNFRRVIVGTRSRVYEIAFSTS